VSDALVQSARGDHSAAPAASLLKGAYFTVSNLSIPD
jgi:hypothetical protein